MTNRNTESEILESKTLNLPDSNSSISVVIVDPDDEFVAQARDELGARGFSLESSPTLEGSLVTLATLASSESTPIVLVDVGLIGPQPRSGLQTLTEGHPELKIFVLTGFMGLDRAIELLDSGAEDLILKPAIWNWVAHRLANSARFQTSGDRTVAGVPADPPPTAADAGEPSAPIPVQGNEATLVAHELRQGLVPLLGYLQFLLQDSLGPVNPEQRESLQLLSGGMDWVNYVAHRHVVGTLRAGDNKTKMELEPLIEWLIEIFTPMAYLRPVEITTFPFAEPILVHLDRDKLVTALYSLLINAIQVAPPGGEIQVHTIREWEHVRIEVRDTAEGLLSHEVDEVFQPLVKGALGREKNPDGPGLGLTIAYRYVEELGGRLEVQTQPGKGSTFSVVLPVDERSNETDGVDLNLLNG